VFQFFDGLRPKLGHKLTNSQQTPFEISWMWLAQHLVHYFTDSAKRRGYKLVRSYEDQQDLFIGTFGDEEYLGGLGIQLFSANYEVYVHIGYFIRGAANGIFVSYFFYCYVA
jgi:hypothetical protein